MKPGFLRTYQQGNFDAAARRRIARAIARGGLSLRKARALFGVRFGGAA